MTRWAVNAGKIITIASVAAVLGYLTETKAVSTFGIVVLPVAAGAIAAFIVQGLLTMTAYAYDLKAKLLKALNESAEKSLDKDIDRMNQKINQMKAITNMNNSPYNFF